MADIFDETETAMVPKTETQLALPGAMGQMQQMADYLSKADIIPTIYKNKPENCFIALEFAQRIGWSALEVMQGLYVIQGKPSWSSQSLITFSNSSGKYTPVRYRMTGEEGTDSWGCIAYMTEKETGELLEGPEVTIGAAKKEGWYQKAGSKWQSLPSLMLHYRAATFLIRLYAPELTMGLRTMEEAEDMKNITPKRETISAVEAAWEAQSE